MPSPATRLITLILLLQRRTGQKAAELAEELGVSVRTIHRYMTRLEEMGIPVYSERGPHGGFSLVRGYKMPPLVLTPEEAVAVYLGTSLVDEMWGQVYRDAAQGALAKLDSLLPDEQRQEVAWARRTLVTTGMHRAELDQVTPYLARLRRAVRERRQVQMTYRGSGQLEPVQRRVDPYALSHRWGWWYGIGYCHLREAIRSFRLDRIQELTMLDRHFAIPDGFDAHQYLSTEPQYRPHVRAKLHFPPESALRALDDRAFWETVEEQADGSVLVTVRAASLEAAASVALTYAPYAVVLEPQDLRTLLGMTGETMTRQYGRRREDTQARA